MRNWPAAVVVASTIASLTLPGAASGQNAPAELRGKSVIAAWTETRMQRVAGQANFRQRSFAQTLNVYISTEGRAFTRRNVSNANGTGRGAGSASSVGVNAGGSQVSQVRGHTLIVTTKFEGGARVARIEFDPAFSSCSATVTLGGANGAEVVRGRTLDGGKPIEIGATTVSGTSCSIRSGNVFAQ